MRLRGQRRLTGTGFELEAGKSTARLGKALAVVRAIGLRLTTPDFDER